MKLELPDNNASVLFHMGEALRKIAHDVDSSFVLSTPADDGRTVHDVAYETLASEQDAAIEEVAVERLANRTPETDVTHEEMLERFDVKPTSDTIDADGLPWDQRIHSRGKTRLADDTWRLARKPNDKTDEEWATYVEEVKAELKALMAIPVVENVNLSEEFDKYLGEVTPPVVEPVVVTPPVVEPVVVTPPVVEPVVVTPPVVEPVVVTPPVVEPVVVTPPVVEATGPTTFGELMRWITSNNKVLTKESIDEVLKAQGLASIALLAARGDLIPQVHMELSKLL